MLTRDYCFATRHIMTDFNKLYNKVIGVFEKNVTGRVLQEFKIEFCFIT